MVPEINLVSANILHLVYRGLLCDHLALPFYEAEMLGELAEHDVQEDHGCSPSLPTMTQLCCFSRLPWAWAFERLPVPPSLGKRCPSCLSVCIQLIAVQLLRCYYHFAHQVLELEQWAQCAAAYVYALM